jgi:hypothetical protein
MKKCNFYPFYALSDGDEENLIKNFIGEIKKQNLTPGR